MPDALVVLLAYGLGSVPFALLLGRRWGADIRRVGSGNLGAANVLRASGVKAGVLVALLDVAKGAASVLVADRITGGGPSVTAAAGLAAIVGHIYPVWLNFRGGKGVATACGVFSVLTPMAVPPAMLIFVITVWVTKYVSLGSVLASAALPTLALVTHGPKPAVVAAFSAAAIIIFRHRSNLARVRGGTERRIGARV